MMLNSHASWMATIAAGLVPTEPHPIMILPFLVLLGCIAVMPFANKTWWEHHYPKVAISLGLCVAAYYMVVLKQPHRLTSVLHEYGSFMALVGSLFVVAGGIHLQVRGEATPFGNCCFLFVGALLSNLLGTTGASMLLIRPWIRMNKYRITDLHVVFFIFLVSNVGGCLTPIGDPPLFLGYLNGVPFLWTAQMLWLPWIVAVGILLVIFYVSDRANFLRAPKQVREEETAERQWELKGWINLGLLGLILAAVFLRSPPGLSELLMVGAAAASLQLTSKELHEANDFSLGPIKEVAWLFAGIFTTMLPALDLLSSHAASLGLDTPTRLYWAAGSLSSVLDNAPTYLSFLAAAVGREGLTLGHPETMAQFIARQPIELMAISLGAVLFGAMTYIGNGPNFMVKAIAEQSKVNTPSFFGYIFRFSIPILLPVLVVIAWFVRSR